MSNLAHDIETLISTSIAVTEGRRSGYYTADDNRTVSEMARAVHDAAKVRNAIKQGRKGCTILFDENGEVDVTPINGAEVVVTNEAPNNSFGPIVSVGPSGPASRNGRPSIARGRLGA